VSLDLKIRAMTKLASTRLEVGWHEVTQRLAVLHGLALSQRSCFRFAPLSADV
jgi:hypothetical protein